MQGHIKRIHHHTKTNFKKAQWSEAYWLEELYVEKGLLCTRYCPCTQAGCAAYLHTCAGNGGTRVFCQCLCGWDAPSEACVSM